MPVFRQDGRAVLFVHVPKAGGSTLERLFAKSGWTTGYRDPKGGVGSMNSVRRCSPQHMHRPMLEQVFRLDRFDAVFMTVREPLATVPLRVRLPQRRPRLGHCGRGRGLVRRGVPGVPARPVRLRQPPSPAVGVPPARRARLPAGGRARGRRQRPQHALGPRTAAALRGAAGARPQRAERHREQRGTAHGGSRATSADGVRRGLRALRILIRGALTRRAKPRSRPDVPVRSSTPLLPVLSGACV